MPPLPPPNPLPNPHDAWAECYDCVYKLTFGELYQSFTRLTLDQIGRLAEPPARIIDFGAGTGRLAVPLAQMGYQVTAVELSIEMARVLGEKAAAGAEGTPTAPCTECQRRTNANIPQRPVQVTVRQHSICSPVETDGFDIGLCVFNVLNYLVEENALPRFASAAASAIRPGGKLLVGFISNLGPMAQRFNGHPIRGRSEHCSVVRNIRIAPVADAVYEFSENSTFTKNGVQSVYSDTFPLRRWSHDQIMAAITGAGFRCVADLTSVFAGVGEHYLLFERSAPTPQAPR